MKVFDKIEESCFPNKEVLKKIVCDLIPLRGNEFMTREYFDMYLNADVRYNTWKDEREDCILNDCLDQNPQYHTFAYNNGEIHKDCISSIRDELINVLETDKYSFAYIYNLLSQKANRLNKLAVYDCVFDSDCIDYAIKFDMDELHKSIDGLPDLKAKYQLCNKALMESLKHPYKGARKVQYEAMCQRLKDEIKSEIELFGYTPAVSKNVGIPDALNTDKAKSIFKELEKLGFMKIANGTLKWLGTNSLFGYFADRASDKLNMRPSNDRIPWEIFKKAFNLDEGSISTAKQAVNSYRNKGLSEPEGFLDIKKVIK